MKSFLSLVAIAMVFALATAEYDWDFCRKYMDKIDDSSQNGQEPEFYDNFYVFMEIKNILNKTVDYVSEYYSSQSQKAFYNINRPANQYQIWVDANSDEILVGPNATTKCVDSPLNGSQIATYLGTTKDAKGDVRLNTPEVALGWHKKYIKASDYLGSSTARGIKTLKWMICSFDPETQITAVTEWHIVDGVYKTLLPVVSTNQAIKPFVPVMAQIRGKNKTDQMNIIDFEMQVDFTFFDTISPTSSFFQIPTQMLCIAKPSEQIPLPSVPTNFRFRGDQAVTYNQNGQGIGPSNLVFTVETYMLDLKIFVQDFVSKPTSVALGNDKSFSRVINDYTTGLSYQMDLLTGACHASAIDPQDIDTVSIAGGNVRIKTTREFFDLDYNQYQYMGIHNIRGIDCDTWSAYFSNSQTVQKQNGLYTWYFANSQWMQNFGFSNWTNPLPVTLEVLTDTSYTQFNIYEFDTQDAYPIPDATLCFEPTGTLNVELVLSATFDQITDLTIPLVRRAIYVTLTEQTGLNTFLRISPPDIQPAGKETMVRFKLFDLHPLHVTGDVPSAQLGPTNQQIFSNLETAVGSNNFSLEIQVYLDNGTLGNTFIYARSNSLGLYSGGKFVGASTTSSSSGSSGYSSGAMAGIAIGMLILGILLGIISLFGFRKVRASTVETATDLKRLDQESES